MGSIQDTTVTAEAVKLPVIDVSNPSREVADQMLAAATKYGFLYIDTNGTGFTKTNVDRMFEISREFFDSPEDQKRKCVIDVDNRGWTALNDEMLDPKTQRKGDFKEALNLTEFDANGHPQQTIPLVLQTRLDEIAHYQELCRETCMKILNVLAMALEIEEADFFTSRHTRPTGTAFRFLKYPAIPEGVEYNPEVDIRAGAHSDYGSVTLLFQRIGQPGLEIRTPQDEWAPVAALPEGYQSDFPPILVNFGDLLSYWTNGLLKSTVHRVIFPQSAKRGGEDRYSIVYFCHPTDQTELIPVPSRIVQAMKPLEDGVEVGYGGGAATTRAVTAKEHLQKRLTATYEYLTKGPKGQTQAEVTTAS